MVVVCRGPPQVELGAGNNRLALVEFAQLAGGAINKYAVLIVGEDEVGLTDTTDGLGGSVWFRCRDCDGPGDLIPRHDLPCRCPVAVSGGGKGKFHKGFAAGGPLHGDSDCPSGLGSDGGDGDRAGVGDGAIDYDAPGAMQIGEGGVKAPIFDAKYAICTVAGSDAYGTR